MKAVDLFCGCGGMSLGFQNAGVEVLAAFDNWEPAINIYSDNFKHPVINCDLNGEDAVAQIKTYNPDIIIGGPPCQDFSHAGKRVEDKRAALTEAYAKIIVEISPRWFVMENVDRAQKSATYSVAKTILKDAGYGLTEVVLGASFCGVPQRRKRFFCIGSLGAADGFLTDYIMQQLDKSETTLRGYFGASLDFEYYYRHPRNYSRRAIYSIDEPSPTVRGMNRPVPPGYPGHPNDAHKLDASIRALTTLERALIQTFPPNFKWLGNKTDMEQMIGNAVPVKLAEFVANALAYHIRSDIDEQSFTVDYSLFFEWLSRTQKMTERVQRDILSRLKRADSICTILSEPEAYYVFLLEQTDAYKALTPTVRSQLKRAVTLYSDYLKTGMAVNA